MRIEESGEIYLRLLTEERNTRRKILSGMGIEHIKIQFIRDKEQL